MNKKRLKRVENSTIRVEKKVENRGGDLPKLTRAEKEVLIFLSQEFLTPKQVAIRRGTSDKAVYKIISNLKKKGVMNRAYSPVEMMVEKRRPTIQPSGHQVRLHGQEFNIKILFKDEKYKRIRGKANLLNVDGNVVRLYRDSLEVYSGQSFFGDDVQGVTARSFKYWSRFFARLEHDLKVNVVKHRFQNIKLVNQHYAEINNELSEECENKGYKIRVYAKEDGKLWFVIDNSFSLHEAETLHPVSAKEDMERVKGVFNDYREFPGVPDPSEVWSLLGECVRHEVEIAKGLGCVVNFLKGQLPKEEESAGFEGRADYFG